MFQFASIVGLPLLVVYPMMGAHRHPEKKENQGHIEMRNAYHRIVYPEGYKRDFGPFFFCVQWTFAGGIGSGLSSPNHFVPVVQ
jgi:hypothetical protein